MIAIVDAPTNLGLRPPQPTSVPGCSKAPEALRGAGLHDRLIAHGAAFSGVVLPGRYVDDWTAGVARVRNQDALIDHALRLATHLEDIFVRHKAPLVIGGDCSLLIGAGVSLARRGRFGLVHIDGHTDFRHPGNSERCASVAGEDLAAAVGLHWAELSQIENLGPYFAKEHVAHVGCRDNDEALDEARGLLAVVVTAQEWAANPDAALSRIRSALDGSTQGYWLHLDVDVLDPAYMPAVDSPDPGGLAPEQLVTLLQALAPHAVGAQVCVFDPDLDPDGRLARLLADIVATGFAALGQRG